MINQRIAPFGTPVQSPSSAPPPQGGGPLEAEALPVVSDAAVLSAGSGRSGTDVLATPVVQGARPASPATGLAGPSPSALIRGAAPAAAAVATSVAASSIGGAIGAALSSFASGTRFVYYGSIYKAEEALTVARQMIHKPLDGLPVPQITVPFVLVPGWTTQPAAFEQLTGYLTRDGNNGGKTVFVQQGAFLEKDAQGSLQPMAQVPADARVFEMVFTDSHQSPDKNVVEMRANFDAIRKATGVPQVDVEGFSMGGLDSRLYIDQGGADIRRLMLLGTPNRGTEFANMVHTLFEKDVQWAMKFGGIIPGDRESIDWLRSEDKNPRLADLNSRWDDQRQAVPILTVGSDFLPTASTTARLGLAGGDGLVEASSLALPHGNTIVLPQAMQHGRLNDDEVMQHVRAIYFGWSLPANAADHFPDDAAIIAQVPVPPPSTSPPQPLPPVACP